jgi:hypothetical protein
MDSSRNFRSIRVTIFANSLRSILLIDLEREPKSFTSRKNHNRSQKNHKMKNLIVLDSKWVDLYCDHIIWYALVLFFDSHEEKYKSKSIKNVSKHSILYVHYVDLLIWSSTQLDFPFYNYSVFCCDFSKLV